MGIGPRLPFNVPNEGEKVSWVGDQKNTMEGGVTYQTHNGGQTKHQDRPPVGVEPSDIYQWEEVT